MSQSSQEFKPKKEVEIKFFRLSPPVLVTSPPLSGIYHNIDSIEDPENIIDNKFTNFEINTLSPYTNQSLFSLSPSFIVSPTNIGVCLHTAFQCGCLFNSVIKHAASIPFVF